MPKVKKRSEPEMLMVSFCDIVTVVTCALFMAVTVTFQEAVKIPVFRPTPIALPTDKTPVFFECRNNEVVFMDKDGLEEQVAKTLSSTLFAVNPSQAVAGAGDKTSEFIIIKVLMEQQIVNEYYVVNPAFLIAGIVALEPKPGTHGDGLKTASMPDSKFRKLLNAMDPKSQYLSFLVREDSFPIFREVRQLSVERGFDVGWELMTVGETIKFGVGGAQVSPE